ncbi:glycine--tRNA ligase subunit beta [Virgibacillus indicus]|uniref:Glycine--tRNA ligase beta subunit n=1 Tax=Virgibacillus indicus TaxID=2024554 RepID=A0A265ND25_9BACI|nr:glycine--tRNA ligase subunit beta [Virgibacillus indicus]OZU89942.1 glycine--tRNA ligase subunit beta [Virgibacillus indicus]
MAKDVLFEIGLEELPARFIDSAQSQLAEHTQIWLKDLRLSYNKITAFSTPRRLAVLITGLAEKQETVEEEAKGPSEKIANDSEGNWSKAAIGFTRGQGKTVDDIYTKEVKGTSYIFVKKHLEGKPAAELLPGFHEIVESIQFGKNMRWAEQKLRYARPIRWLVGLYGNEIIPFKIAGVKSGNLTFGHRFLGDEITLDDPVKYQEALRENFVIADPKEREKLILEGIRQLEKQENCKVPIDQELLDEVRNLVEFPTVFEGTFEEHFLKLPQEVLITSMKEHQRYFPVKSVKGDLLPRFVGVKNGDSHAIEKVIKGNEKVIHARLSDAVFFYEEDQKKSLNHYLEKLDRVIFQEKLGTVSDKVTRVVHLTRQLTELLELDKDTAVIAERTAEISKFDLMTNMVNEFTELQGVIGEKYALNFGEDKAVAIAVREHYLPKQANGELPQTSAGAIVSIADKLDTIAGCITAGLIPTGSQDPYGLRRQTSGILRIMADRQWRISIEALLKLTHSLYPSLEAEKQSDGQTGKELQEFFTVRASYLLKEMGIEQDVIQAVLSREIGIINYSFDKAKVLSEKRNDEQFKYIQEALVRVLNLANKTDLFEVEPAYFETASEKNLYDKFHSVSVDFKAADEDKDAELALSKLGELAEYIHEFFDNNMVMAEDKRLRNNRLSLVNNIARLISDYADLSTIEWKQHF